MKKLITLLLLATTTIINAQEIDYFADNPQWRMHLTFGGAMPCLEQWDYVYYVNGTDTINGIEYAQLYEIRTIEYEWMNPPPVGCSGTYTYGPGLRGLFRQEDRKIFMREDGNNILIYDFDLQVGDALPDSPMYEPGIFVTGIDSILIGANYRDIFSLSTNYFTNPDILIEGIGFEYGFLEPFPGWYPEELVCFSLDGLVYYENPNPPAPCDMFVGIFDHPAKDINLEIYPNPTSGLITIRTESLAAKDVSIEISDLSGREIINKPWRLEFGLNAIYLDLSGYNPGMYFVTLSAEIGETISRKKIIVE